MIINFFISVLCVDLDLLKACCLEAIKVILSHKCSYFSMQLSKPNSHFSEIFHQMIRLDLLNVNWLLQCHIKFNLTMM